MIKIVLDSWREGFEKVSLTKLQMDMLGKSLRESKINVDSLLENKKVIIEINNIDLANEFLRETKRIGVNCKLLVD
ncbi:hypothetical protein [Chryseobacterium balustinum]|uniref:Uncharacterized protein n=1 Tax=Chryseobacterium balustinum TaxID=246 RepID=A0AAX2IS53_9FLAO|nr:hypothetical protein [Chryseobacterium balustinum]AZB28461.1 hypothetical protein EB354_03830 [Chryseobacterium balustinum]SKC13085.1 hypothetical protein SAMN05421800_1446 [Chryseobacterium balustinum]SQA92546.1 Uncharacterised protein [Chryseobacterium balustinum]